MTFNDIAIAIANETRLRILAILDEHEAIEIGALARALGIAASTATHHIARLEHAGLVARVRCGRSALVESLGWVEILVHRKPFERIPESTHRLETARP